MKSLFRHAAFSAVFFLIFSLIVSLQAAIPPPHGPISDFAGVLSGEDTARIAAVIDRVETKTTAEIFIVTVTSLDGLTVEDYANQLFQKWGIGKKKKDNGLLILVCPDEHKMRIEAGYGMEAVIPDGLAGEVIRNICIPAFKNNDYSGGIAAGVEQLGKFIEGSESAEEWRNSAQGKEEFGGFFPSLGLSLFFSIFICLGMGALGYAFSSRVGFFILWGGMFAGIPGIMLMAWPGLGLFRWIPVILGIAAFVLGFKLGLKNPPTKGRKGKGGGGGGWIWGASSGSSGGSDWGSGGGFSSGGGGGGGGSSGGGGASGSW